jgi:hypothetical protein
MAQFEAPAAAGSLDSSGHKRVLHQQHGLRREDDSTADSVPRSAKRSKASSEVMMKQTEQMQLSYAQMPAQVSCNRGYALHAQEPCTWYVVHVMTV